MNVILRPFSFVGRAERMEYIITTLAALAPLIILFLLFFSGSSIIRGFGDGFLIFLMVYVIVMIWVCMAAAVRRNHDLGLSGPAGFFNTELLFRRGILGYNRFGYDRSTKYRENIAMIESTLECGRYWKSTYDDEVADVILKCVEMAAFDGEKCFQYYYYYQDGTLLFSVTTACDYSIDYDMNQDIYTISFLNQETVDVKNENCNQELFEEFYAEWIDDDYSNDDDTDENGSDDEICEEEDEEIEYDDDDENNDYDMRIFDVTSSSIVLISDYEEKNSYEKEDIYVYLKDKKINK